MTFYKGGYITTTNRWLVEIATGVTKQTATLSSRISLRMCTNYESGPGWPGEQLLHLLHTSYATAFYASTLDSRRLDTRRLWRLNAAPQTKILPTPLLMSILECNRAERRQILTQCHSHTHTRT